MEDQLNYEDTLAKVRKLSESATLSSSIKPTQPASEEDAAPPEPPPRLE